MWENRGAAVAIVVGSGCRGFGSKQKQNRLQAAGRWAICDLNVIGGGGKTNKSNKSL